MITLITDFPANDNNSISFKFHTGNISTKDAEILFPLKNLSNFWRTLEMYLIIAKLAFSWNGLKIAVQSLLMHQIKYQYLK